MKGPFNSQVECSSSLAAARRVSEEENGQNSRGNPRILCIGGMVMIANERYGEREKEMRLCLVGSSNNNLRLGTRARRDRCGKRE